MALLSVEAGAQKRDARQRSAETIVADGLAQLPAAKKAVFDRVMGEIAATGEKGVELIAAMMVPAAEGKNSVFEYALSGVTAFVTAPENGALREGVRQGLKTAIKKCGDKCGDNANRTFLLSQLQLCSTKEDVEEIAAYLEDPYLKDAALSALISTPGSEEYLLSAAKQENLSQKRKCDLAYAFGQKRLATAEPLLLSWLPGADAKSLEVIYHALSLCGSAAAIKPLSKAAKDAEYKDEPTGATHACLDLLGNLIRRGDSRPALEPVKKLLKCRQSYVRGAALSLWTEARGIEVSMPELLDAIRYGNKEFRFAALQTLGKGNDNIFAAVTAILPKCSVEAQTAVITWLGECGAASQSTAIAKAVKSSEPGLAKAAIEAAGRIGGGEALEALAGALSGAYAAEAKRALLAFHGEIEPQVKKLLDSGNGQVLVYALQLAAERHLHVTDRVFELLKSDDGHVSKAAYATLQSVATVGDADRLASLLDSTDEQHVGSVQQALTHTLASLSKEQQYAKITGYMSASEKTDRYYPVLANTNTDQAVRKLLNDFKASGDSHAFEALLKVENPLMYDILYELATEEKSLADKALSRYADLVMTTGMTPEMRYLLSRRGAELTPSAKVLEQLVSNLKNVYIQPAMLFASRYLSDNKVNHTAADAVKNIVGKSPAMPGGESVRKILDEACNVYRNWDDADAGYAVNEITDLMTKLPEKGFTELSLGNSEDWKPLPPAGNPNTHIPKALAGLTDRNWNSENGKIIFSGNEACGISDGKEYENFELWIEWRSEGGAGLVLRSMPLIGLGNEKGYPYATAKADNRPGEWNLLYVKVTDDRMTVSENGIVIAENAVLSDPARPGLPVNARGLIGLAGDKSKAEFRSILVNELPATPVFELSPEEKAAGYEVLFDGRSLHKWIGNKTNYMPKDGTIYVTASYGGSGNLYTAKEYGNFNYRFEFRFLNHGVNNGIGIRTSQGVDAAYEGMEIQVLDHDDPIYKDLHIYQQHGSVYGIIPAKHVHFPEFGAWNTMEINAKGDHITVIVNGETIVDGNIREACQGHNTAENGAADNPYTVDHRNHPGLFNKKGHVCFCGHGAGIQFRNVRIKEL